MALTKNIGRKQSFQQHTSTCQIILSNKKATCEIFYYASSQKKKEKEEKIDTDGRTLGMYDKCTMHHTFYKPF